MVWSGHGKDACDKSDAYGFANMLKTTLSSMLVTQQAENMEELLMTFINFTVCRFCPLKFN